MSQKDYYFANNMITGFGDTWFLQVFHKAKDSAGSDLLGSIVDKLGSIFSRHPSPYHMAKPEAVLQAIQKNREALVISTDDPIVLSSTLGPSNQSLSIKRSHVLQADVANLPNVPIALQLAVDYSRLSQFTFNLDAGARVAYIPTAYLNKLYAWCDGKYQIAMPSVGVEVDENYIVDQVLIARNIGMKFTSSEKFNASFVAKVEYLNAQVGATVKYTIEDEKILSATVNDGIDYLIGFKTIRWDDLG